MSDDPRCAKCGHPRNNHPYRHPFVGPSKGDTIKTQADRIKELEAENKKLRKGLEIYQRERDRFKHATPEMSGAYFLTGGHGPTDDNQMPQFVEIVPAYGCGWSMVYEYTGRTISHEGS